MDLLAGAQQWQDKAWLDAVFLVRVVYPDGFVRCGQCVLVDAEAEFGGEVEKAGGLGRARQEFIHGVVVSWRACGEEYS